MTKFIVALAFVGLNFYAYHFMAREAVIPDRESFSFFPRQLGSWRCVEQSKLEDDVLGNLGVTDYLLCRYFRGRSQHVVDVYVGYHATQVREEGGGAGENSIHPPAHCLPGSGWDIIDNQTLPASIPGLPDPDGQIKRMVIAKGKARQLVYYWYQSRGRVIGQDWQKIAYMGLDRATMGRTDGSLVRFTTPIIRNDEESADAAIREVAAGVAAKLPRFVPN